MMLKKVIYITNDIPPYLFNDHCIIEQKPTEISSYITYNNSNAIIGVLLNLVLFTCFYYTFFFHLIYFFMMTIIQ